MNIFLDLDGVMFDFEGFFESHFGFRHDSISDAQMWKHINDHENFFGSLPLMQDAELLFDFCKNLTGDLPIFLTACPKSDYARHALAKIDRVREVFGPEPFILPVMGGKNKALFMHKAGDVLIDDFEKNILPWTERGGMGIHHKNVADTITILKETFVSK